MPEEPQLNVRGVLRAPAPPTLPGVRFLTITAALVLAALCASPALATFPGRNGEIAFVRSGDIWAVEADGTGLHRITRDPGDEWAPAWSPDGRRLVFSRERDGNRDIWSAAADGSDERQLTTTDADEYEPTWSPDGLRIAFSRFRAEIMGGDVYVADADGRNEHPIFVQGWGPDWSPVGGRIAVAAGLSDGARVAFIGDEGQEYGDLPTDRPEAFGGGIDGGASWAPDGTRLVYSRARYDDDGLLSAALVVNAFSRSEKVIDEGRAGYYESSWSPDARSIVFSAQSKLWIVPPEGGQPHAITTGPAGAAMPAWRPLPVPVSPATPAPGPAVGTGAAPITRLRVLRLSSPSRVRMGARVDIVLKLDGTPVGPVTLQRRTRGAFRTLVSIRPKGAVARLRFRPAAAGRLRLRVVLRTGGVLVRKPLSMLVLPR